MYSFILAGRAKDVFRVLRYLVLIELLVTSVPYEIPDECYYYIN